MTLLFLAALAGPLIVLACSAVTLVAIHGVFGRLAQKQDQRGTADLNDELRIRRHQLRQPIAPPSTLRPSKTTRQPTSRCG
jgi:hypothetical protein